MKKSLLFAAGVALAAMPLAAQKLGVGYVTWPTSEKLHTYIQAWNGGSGTITIDGKTWEDANFFISRVKPKARFYDTNTQVYPGITQWSTSNKNGNDKRVCFWVPVSDEKRNGVKLNAMPDGSMDGEVFSMWSYVDNFGNWNSPYGWTPGAFSDVCHKNGVSTHGVAGVPFGSLGDWRTTFTTLNSLGGETVGKFLYYFGQDGLGYNSEWGSPGASSIGLTTLHDALTKYMASRNPLWEVMWYAGVGDNGGNYFDQGIGSFTGLYKGASMFLNYNWNNASTMSSSISTSEGMSKSPFYIYAGMNMQGGEPKSGSNYDLLKDYKHSIGLWGAHSVNMLWLDRTSNGSSPMAKAATYQRMIERWFGNGVRNPAIKMTPKLVRNHRPTDDWAGMSSMMSERSTLKWNPKNDEPFYTFFNLGNGQFFNWKGDRQHNNEWYNIGVQDYLPTWRFWFAPTYMGGRTTTLSKSDQHMDAAFTWEDAYVGGSCLKISGTASQEYLHLFKTQFNVSRSDTKYRVTFKITGGSANVDLVLGFGTKAAEFTKSLIAKADCADLEDKSYNEGAAGWTTLEFDLETETVTSQNSIRVIGLKFTDAENLEMLLGGFEIVRNDWVTPATPTLTLTKVLAYNNSGVDAKLIWDMNPGNTIKGVGEPCYNSDVNTSLFRMWAQQEGCEPQNLGITTSWAGLIYAAKVDAGGAKKMRFGVSALSMDTKNESEIAWSDYQTLPAYDLVDDITINKSIIKPGESFELSFVDPQHASATWTITDTEGNTLWSGSGKTVTVPGLDGVGSYTLSVTSNGETTEFPRYISISSEAVGALPEIYTLTMDGDRVDQMGDGSAVEITLNDAKTFGYTGRKADGSASRGVDLNEKWFGVSCAQLGLTSNKSFSVAAWVKYNELPAGLSSFITIEDRINGGWPMDNWGFFWSRINEHGKFVIDKIDTSWGMRMGQGTEGQRLFYRYDDAKIDVGAWTHIAICFEYKAGTNQMRQHFYINGKKQMVSQWAYCLKSDFEDIVNSTSNNLTWSDIYEVARRISGASYGKDTYEPDFVADNYTITNGMWIAFGGTSQEISAVKGCVDDFQIWGKSMDDNDVALSMAGLDKNNLPADVIGYWDLEEDAVNDGSGNLAFIGACGANSTATSPKAYWYDIPSEGENSNTMVYGQPTFLAGCPFIAGTAYPITTTPTWTTRHASVEGNGTGESGSANIAWNKAGDYAVQLKLANGHGEATMDYPVIRIKDSSQGIEDIVSDGDGFAAYTIEDALFVEFDGDGTYDVEVFNMAGLTVGKKQLVATAGQNARISLGAAGVYLVKVAKDGQLLRTVKVIRK